MLANFELTNKPVFGGIVNNDILIFRIILEIVEKRILIVTDHKKQTKGKEN